GVEGIDVGVEGGNALDDQVIAAAGLEHTLRAADQDVAAEAVDQFARAGAGDQHIIGAAAAVVENAVAVAGDDEGGNANAADFRSAGAALQVNDVVAILAVDDDMSARLEIAEELPIDHHVDPTEGVGREEGDDVVAGRAGDDELRLAGSQRVGSQAHGRLRGEAGTAGIGDDAV